MKIAFIRESEVKDLNPDIAKTEPLSATETGFIHLADELSVYHEVKVFCPTIRNTTYVNKGTVEYIPLSSTKKSIGVERHISAKLSDFYPDVVIVVGNPRFLMLPFLDEYNKIFWMHNHPLEMDKYNKFINQAGHEDQFTIVTPSKEAAEFAQNFYHNPCIKGLYPGVRDVFFDRYEKKEKNKILYVGPLSPSKGALEFLKAAVTLKQYKFYVCGCYDMYGYAVPGYKEACEQYRGAHITYLGGLGPEDLAREMASAELCVVNPIVGNLETCSVSALEAMAAGTPVLSGGKSLITPIIEKGGKCYRGSLSKAIRDIMSNNALIPDAREWVKNFTFEHIALQWNRLLFNGKEHTNCVSSRS